MKNSHRRSASSKKSLENASSVSVKINKSNTENTKLLERFYEEDDTYSIVYAVRENLIKQVLESCYEKYLEKQSVKFLVNCTYKALIKLIDLNFYVHNPVWPYFKSHPDWSEDLPPEPSPPDTWAAYNVPFNRPKPETVDSLSTDLSSNEPEMYAPSSTELGLNQYLYETYDLQQEYIAEESEIDYKIVELERSLSDFSKIKVATNKQDLPCMPKSSFFFNTPILVKKSQPLDGLPKVFTTSIKEQLLVPLRAQLRYKFNEEVTKTSKEK